jgi:hypothetical protein
MVQGVAVRGRFMASAPPLDTLHIYPKTARLTVNKNGPDLSQGETPETTTKLGLDLMATIKKTADKRSVPPFQFPLCDSTVVPLSLVRG